jgi:curved DNA-binding protein CbpA
MKDYYYVLGIEKTASIEEIKTAYRKLSIKFHPDHNSNDKFFEKKFLEIKDAYDILSDKEKRKEYDNKYFKENNPNEFANINENSDRRTTSNNNNSPMNSPIKSQPNYLSRKVIGFIIICLIVLVLSIIRKKASQSINQEAIQDYSASVKSQSNKLVEVDSFKAPSGENVVIIDTPSKVDTSNIKTVAQKLSTDTMKIYPSKEVTIAWILEKLRNYSEDTYISSNSFQDANTGLKFYSSVHSKNFKFDFDDNFLIINYKEENTNNESVTLYSKKALIPIYDINSISSYYINTSKQTIQIFDSSNTKYVTDQFDLRIKENSETNLIERIDSAFMKLKRYYKKPENTEAF